MEDDVFYVRSAANASNYEAMADFIINCTKKIFERDNNITESLQALTRADAHQWGLSLSASSESDIKERSGKKRQFKIKHRLEVDESL
eukprot:15366508-Ditylum_brightwellii.AAC.1